VAKLFRVGSGGNSMAPVLDGSIKFTLVDGATGGRLSTDKNASSGVPELIVGGDTTTVVYWWLGPNSTATGGYHLNIRGVAPLGGNTIAVTDNTHTGHPVSVATTPPIVSLNHHRAGMTDIDVDTEAAEPPVVTTNFDELKLEYNSVASVPLRVKTIQRPRAKMDRESYQGEHFQILDSGNWAKGRKKNVKGSEVGCFLNRAKPMTAREQ
jgi:hypothetical protein